LSCPAITQSTESEEMNKFSKPGILAAGGLALSLVLITACSGPTEDVRVTLCKNLTSAMQLSSQSIEWKGNENTFHRPEYAVTSLSFDVVDRDGGRTAMQSACHYAYEELEDTALNLANPMDAYATLPFAMTIDGRALSDAELLRMVNEEQKRQGRQIISTLEKGARDMADKVRAGIGQ
jgi:hypothetical protein